jgi:hypothetical protein
VSRVGTPADLEQRVRLDPGHHPARPVSLTSQASRSASPTGPLRSDTRR